MKKPRIMLVEDERVVAADIEECVRGLGYTVLGSVASGYDALRMAVRTTPDLVLMDIKLKGTLDGVEVGGALRNQLRIPVVYLTAHADAEILERAKKTAPAGYVLKPFDDRTLRAAIEIALERFHGEMQLIEWGERLSTAVASIDEALLLTDEGGRVVMLNRLAEKLTGWHQAEVSGKSVREVFSLFNADNGSMQDSVVGRAFREGISVGLGDKAVLLGRDGGRTPVQGSAMPVRDGDSCMGVCIVFRPLGVRTRDENWGAPEHQLSGRLEIMGRLTADVAKQFLGLLQTDPNRGARLARRLGEFGQRTPEERATVDVNQFIAGLEDLLRCTLGDIELAITFGSDTGTVRADPGQLELLLVYLALNARTSVAGGQLCIRTSKYVAESSPDCYAEIALSHTGLGWDPATDLPGIDEIAGMTDNEIRVVTESRKVKIYLPEAASAE